ncbi:SH3 domain-containing protein, partial [Hyaloscypha finlandica]
LAKLPDLFCVKAMYDYEADDRAALSFHKGDIIQVLGMLESGWWDGVINGVRGWFPCNYTFIIKPPHQDLETSHDEKDYEESDDDESGEDEIDYENCEGSDDEESDVFWIPQATPDGPLFHFNVQTGEASLEPPKKAEMKE